MEATSKQKVLHVEFSITSSMPVGRNRKSRFHTFTNTDNHRISLELDHNSWYPT